MIDEDAEIRELALALINTAQEAGAAIMQAYHPDITVRFKDDGSPVTDADQAAEEIILRDLQRLLPKVPVIAEEQAAAGNLPQCKDLFFLVDPVDGTKEFLKGTGEFTVNIALIKGNAPCFGLVYAPALRQCFVTIGSGRAVCFELSASAQPVSTASLEFQPVTGKVPTERVLTAIMSGSNIRHETQAFLERVGARKWLRMGSSLKFCVIARGDADVYPRHGPTSEWDTAAGQAILEAAGGLVVTLNKTSLSYGKSENSFVNPAFIALRRPKYLAALG